MVKEICPNLFCIEVPLPGSPLKYLNSYVVRTSDRSLIIDTGFNHKVCHDTMVNGLNEIGVDLADADIFITHFHADHFGLVPKLKKPATIASESSVEIMPASASISAWAILPRISCSYRRQS